MRCCLPNRGGYIKIEVQVIAGHHMVNHKETLIDSLILSVIIMGKRAHKKVLPEV